MSDKFKGKYRTDSMRMQKWNYGWNASYFVTICTENRAHFFGEIKDKKMQLSEIGCIAEQTWFQIPKQFDCMKIEAFVVMQNHIHGIIKIIKPRDWDAINATLEKKPHRGGITQEHNPMLYLNLSRIIRWYKGRVTYEARKIKEGFGWQSRFHEHVIRDTTAHKNIKLYIQRNPELWEQDKYN